MILNDLLCKLDNLSQRGEQYTALCPAHDDKNPSLAVTEKDGKILLKCWAGCASIEIVEALGLKLSDLFTDSGMNQKQCHAYAKQKSKRQSRKALSFECHMLYQISTSRIASDDLVLDSKFMNARPEYAPMPEGGWERELLAVQRIRELLSELYK